MRSSRYVLRHDRYREYRIVVTAQGRDAVIQQRVATIRSLGLPRWITLAELPAVVGRGGRDVPSEALLRVAQDPVTHFLQYLTLGDVSDTPDLSTAAAVAGRQPLSRVGAVFVSYRRGDTEFWAHALARHLAGRVGRDSVFIDVASEQLGQDYRDQIDEALRRCSDVVVMIGDHFFDEGSHGLRRIDEPDDWVRTEIASALAPDKRAFVVLVGDAAKPIRSELPTQIRLLADVASVERLATRKDLVRVGDAILSPRQQHRRPAIHARMDLRWLAPDRQAYEVAARSILADLARVGWLTVRARKEDDRTGDRYVVHSDKHPRYRMVVLVRSADVVLEERAHSIRRAGFPTWVSRAKFSFSPRRPGKADLLRTPSALLEVAHDPDTYLEVVGRHDLGRFGRRLPSADSMGTTPRQWAASPDYVEEYQEALRSTKRRHRLQGLQRLGWYEAESSEWEVRGVAFHPDGERAALAHESEIVLFSTRDGCPTGTWAGAGLWQAIVFSSTGRLAGLAVREFRGTGYGGRMALWDSDGTPLMNRPIPTSVWRRLTTFMGYLPARAFHGLDIDASGECLACSTPSGVWIYRARNDVFRRWPQDWPAGSDVAFLPLADELVAVGAGSLYRIGVDSLEVLARSDQPRPDTTQELGWRLDTDDRVGFSIGTSLSPSPTGELLAVATDAGRIAHFDADRLVLLRSEQWFSPSADVEVVGYSPDGRWIAAVAGATLVVGRAKGLEPVFEAHVADNDDLPWWPGPLSRGRLVTCLSGCLVT